MILIKLIQHLFSSHFRLQVVELGRLQSVLMENVEEQAVVADMVHDTVVHATDNVQEGNEQVRGRVFAIEDGVECSYPEIYIHYPSISPSKG